MIDVKVSTVPGTIKELALEDGASVTDAVEAAGLSLSGFTITINGSSGSHSTRLQDGDRVVLTKNAKGNG